jgi:nicotinate dehydrogenase subunit B
LGAEKSGKNNYLAGGFAEGWEAPPLNELSKAPIAWTEQSLFEYLRTGFSSLHGVASGPMAPVVEGLAQLPESDVRAIAHYLSSMNPAVPEREPAALTAAKLEDASKNNRAVTTMPGESLFEGACAVCHDAREGPPLFGSRPSLALNTNLHSDHPDNVIQVLMHGIADPTQLGLGAMPEFKNSFNNQQMKNLLEYMRARFAPEKAPWQGLDEKINAIRNQTVR